MQRWTRLSSTPLIDDRWLRITADRCETAAGTIVDPYYVMHEKSWVHVYAVDGRGEVLTVRQYRYAADAVCTELPGGVVEPGEDPQVAAARELLEETGYGAARWSHVGRLYANPARQTNAIHIFIAEDLHPAGPQRLDATEDIAWSFQTPDQIDAAIERGEFSQALHVATLYRVRQFMQGRSAG